VAASLAAAPLAAQHSADHARHHPPGDTAFAALQARGRTHMGVDQYASTHRFDALPDGGRIELQSDRADTAAVSAIRAHMRDNRRRVRTRRLHDAGLVHLKAVPGAKVMAAKRAAIAYAPRDLPRGGRAAHPHARPRGVRAIAEFMAFQRTEHRAGGHR
jgi:hypothetical protein